MTRFYFHAATNALSNLPTTEQSSLTSIKNVDALTVNRTMNTTIGTSQTTLVLTSNATVSAQNYYFTRFVSPALSGVSSITAQTWIYNFGAMESNTNANFPVNSFGSVRATAYVWRPSSQTKVGNILDGTTSGSIGEAGASQAIVQEDTFSGSLVSSVSDGDVICFEVWFVITQGAATAYTDTFYYDGTTVDRSPTDPVSNLASFLETPQTLTFAGGVTNYNRALPTETISVSESLARLAAHPRVMTTQTTTIGETLARQAVTNRAIATQTVTGSESLARQAVNSRAMATETVTIGESQQRVVVTNRSLAAETVTSSESLARQFVGSRAIPETISITDAVATEVHVGAQAFVRALPTETVTISESLNRQFIGSRALSPETITVGESATRTLNLSRALLPSVAVVGVSLAGTDDYINCGNDTALWSQGLTKFSFSLWIKPSVLHTGNYQLIVDHGWFANGAFCLYQDSSTNDIAFAFMDSGGVTKESRYTLPGTLLNTWIHITGVFDNTLSGGDAKLYVNGLPLGSVSDDTTDNIGYTGNLTIGFSTTMFSSLQDGQVKDFRWWTTKALTQTEITDTYNNSGSAPTPNYWLKMDEGTGNPVDTITGTKTATLTNGATWSTGSGSGESVLITESIAIQKGLVRTLATETVSISDSVTTVLTTQGVQYVRTLPTETTTISENLARVLNTNRPLTVQTTSVSETLARLYAATRTIPTETVAVAENIQTAKGFIRTIATQIVTISESLARVFNGQRVLPTETVTVGSGTLARAYSAMRSLATETTSVSESLARLTNNIRALATETVTITGGTVARLLGASRQLASETVAISETIARLFTGSRLMATQTTTISDSVATLYTPAPPAGVFERQMPLEIVAITESLNRVVTNSRTLIPETTTVSESLGRVFGVSRTLPTQTIPTVTESLIRSYGSTRSFAENVNVIDSLNRLYGASRTIPPETTSITETVNRLYSTVRALPLQTVNISDSVDTLIQVGAGAFVRVLVESVNVLGIVSRTFQGTRTLVETIPISELLEIPAPAPVPIPERIPLRPLPRTETVGRNNLRPFHISQDIKPYPEPTGISVRISDKDEFTGPETKGRTMNETAKNIFGNIIGMLRKKERDPDLEF